MGIQKFIIFFKNEGLVRLAAKLGFYTSNQLSFQLVGHPIVRLLMFILIWSPIYCQKLFAQNSCVKKVDIQNDSAYNNRETNNAIALAFANAAINDAKKCNYLAGFATACNNLGLILRVRGEYNNSFHAFSKGLEVRLQLMDSLGAASILNNLGVLKREQGDYESSLAYHFRALDIIKNNGADSLKIASVYFNIANAFEHEGDYERAIEFNKKNIEILSKYNNDEKIMDSKYNLASKLFRIGSLKEAHKILNEVCFYYENKNIWQDWSLCLDLLGQVEMHEQLYEDAYTHFKASIEIVMKNDDAYFGLLGSYINIGELLLLRNDPMEALKYFLYAKEILQDNRGGSQDSVFVFSGLASSYARLNQFDSAYYYQTESKRFQDSIYSKEKAIAIAEMQTKYETAEKERLASEAQLLAEKATARSRTFLALFLAALAVTGSLFFYFRHRQRTAALIAKQQEQLHLKEVEELLKDQEIKSINAVLEGQETERIRIAKDLHDRLGSMLTTAKWSFESYLEEHSGNGQVEPLMKSTLLLDDAYQEVRRIAHDMVSGVLTKFGLVPAVEELCNAINDSKRLQVKLITFGMDARPDNNVEVVLYRVVQELLSNILKHAKASLVTVQIGRVEQELTVSVEDNGIGFDPDLAQKGMGLKNIEARVNGLNGSVHFDTGKGNGTSVMIEVPV